MSKWFKEHWIPDESTAKSGALPRAVERIAVINFSSGSDALDPTATATLDRALQSIGSVEQRKIVIGGGTDTVGPDAGNYVLAKRRADAVSSYMKSRLNGEANLKVDSFGERRLEVRTLDQVRQAANRAVIVELVP
jgi:outer membrane protein OmpA-like peptidoglycan-associated protein